MSILRTENLQHVLGYAQNEAAQRHNLYLDVEHMLLGLLRHRSGPVCRLLEDRGTDLEALYAQVADAVGVERPEPIEVKDTTRWAKAAMERAFEEARNMGNSAVGSRHLLLALMQEEDGAVHDALAGLALTADDVRADLRAHGATPAARVASAPDAEGDPEIVLIPTRRGGQAHRPRPARRPDQKNASPTWPWLMVGVGLLLVYMLFVLPGNALFTFVFVLVGWIFSLTLHEFAHALVAYMGGDYTVRDKGYLSFNPLKYTHPMLSIALPLMFLAMGGIGLPGGAVYIERHRLRNKWWGAAVSAAGPAANLLFALVLALPFITGLVDTDIIGFKIGRETNTINGEVGTIWQDASLWSAVAFLAMLQITAVAFNLLPIPPLDGFGILEPLLDERTRFQLRQLGTYGLLLIIVILWTPLGEGFWDMIYEIVKALHIPGWLISEGFENFMFWRDPPS